MMRERKIIYLCKIMFLILFLYSSYFYEYLKENENEKRKLFTSIFMYIIKHQNLCINIKIHRISITFLIFLFDS